MLIAKYFHCVAHRRSRHDTTVQSLLVTIPLITQVSATWPKSRNAAPRQTYNPALPDTSPSHLALAVNFQHITYFNSAMALPSYALHVCGAATSVAATAGLLWFGLHAYEQDRMSKHRHSMEMHLRTTLSLFQPIRGFVPYLT